MDNYSDDRKFREIIRLFERKLGLLTDNEMSCCGVTMAQCHAIVEIGRAGSISLNELANLLNLDNSTMSRTVNNLVTGNLARRDLDPQDRRYVTISLTEEGSRIFEGIETNTGSYFKKVYETIPENKRGQVLESLQILLSALEENDCCK